MNSKCSGLISPKGLRTATNVFLIFIGIIFIIGSVGEFSDLAIIRNAIAGNPQMGALQSAVNAISGEAFSLLIIGMITCVFGIICAAKNKDGFAHKNCFVLALIAISLFTLLINIFDGVALVSYGELNLSIIDFVGTGIALISLALFFLCWLEGKKNGNHEKIFGILGSVCLLIIRILTSSVTIIGGMNQYNPNIAGTVFGALLGIAVYVIFLMYFIKLHNYSEMDHAASGEQRGNYSASDISFQADILTKYKDLLDRGVITQEEFDEKKDEILNKQ